MTILATAIVNALLVAATLAVLAYVCRIPFRLDRSVSLAVARRRVDAESERERLAA